MSVLYLDASAFVKTVVDEPESDTLERYLAREPRRVVSSALLHAEALRAGRRHGPAASAKMREALQHVDLVDVDAPILNAASVLDPPTLRTLDALHLATALSVSDELESLVTYDSRMIEAAAAVGISTVSPR